MIKFSGKKIYVDPKLAMFADKYIQTDLSESMSLHQLSSMFWRRSQTIISRTAFQSAAVSRIPQPLHNFEVSGVKFTHGSLEVTRGKRTKSGGSSPQKIRLGNFRVKIGRFKKRSVLIFMLTVNMLSLIGRVRKAPYRLKLSYEDLLRHRTIHRAWQLVKRQERESRNTELMTQYQKIQVACDELEKASPELFAQAMDKPKSLRFPPEYRIPTETPPNVSWDSSWKKATLPQVK